MTYFTKKTKGVGLSIRVACHPPQHRAAAALVQVGGMVD
jgi:hypothetical protein